MAGKKSLECIELLGRQRLVDRLLPPMEQQKQFAAFVRLSDKSNNKLQIEPLMKG